MYTLGLSRPWNTIEPAWSSFKGNDPDNVTAPLSFFAATHVPISDYFFIDGGSCANLNKAQNIYFNIQKGTWASSSLKGEQLARRYTKEREREKRKEYDQHLLLFVI